MNDALTLDHHSAMRSIDPAPFREFMGVPASVSLGTMPGLVWLPVTSLRIDPAYQREVLRNGARNIGRIAREFDWAKFGVVIVANIGANLFAIVDGQHRTLAAALRNIEEVPCLIIEADPGKQAEAFAAINGAVTKISPLQIFNAQLAAGNEKAAALRDTCRAAGVTICRYPVASNNMRLGETLAVGTLRRCLDIYGAGVLTLGLKALVVRGPCDIGMVIEPTIKAICNVLDAERSWMTSEAALLQAMRKFDLAREVREAEVVSKQRRIQVSAALSLRLFDFLDAELGA